MDAGTAGISQVLGNWSRAAPDAPAAAAARPPHAAIARVWQVGRWILRARANEAGTVERLQHEARLVDAARGLVPWPLPDLLAANDGRRFVLADDAVWTLHLALPGRMIRAWQELHRAPPAERDRLLHLLRRLHDATRGRLDAPDPLWLVRDVTVRLARVRGRLPLGAVLAVEAALERVARAAASAAPRDLAFVHGDFHGGNVLADDDGRVCGLVDLDWCRIARPLEDLAYTAMMLARATPAVPPVDALLQVAGTYGLDPSKHGEFLDCAVLYALFDVDLFVAADGLADRARWLAVQSALLVAICAGL